MAAPLPNAFIMALELDQLRFGFEEVKQPRAHATRCAEFYDLNA
jgi:hypothetical protein